MCRRNLGDNTPCTRSWRRYFLHPEVVTSMIDAARMIAVWQVGKSMADLNSTRDTAGC
jgi:hypothetical protein